MEWENDLVVTDIVDGREIVLILGGGGVKVKDGNINLDYVDAIMIVDRNGKIVYSVRYNPRFDSDGCDDVLESVLNKNFLEVYPNIDPKESSTVRSLETGKPVYMERQRFTDFTGRAITTTNLTIPIIRNGQILGVVELSKDVTKFNESTSPKKLRNRVERGTSNLYSFEDILTTNPEMKLNIIKARSIAESRSSAIVYGETGTGKELFIQAIHNGSDRAGKPFVAHNCAALPESLFETILFGSVKGAFTGSIDRSGLFEEADGGTLFLDELNSMPKNLQAKLLRVLQDGRVRRVGDTKDKQVDVRVVAAMNMDPMTAMERGFLREDLFFRLGVMTLRLLPLRERKEDIPLYIEHFINRFNSQFGKSVERISRDVEKLFLEYPWPGNVRELQHIIESCMSFTDRKVIELDDLPAYLNREPSSYLLQSKNLEGKTIEEFGSLDNLLETIEKDMILRTLKNTGWNISKAAKLLRITRQKLHYKLNKYGIEIEA
jgi:arginine utilization regulatory protein